MKISEIVKRGLQVPEPNASSTYSLARLLGHEAYDTDPIKTDTDALKTYSGWVYACVSTISQDVRTSTWKIWDKRAGLEEDWEPIQDSTIPQVLKRPSETQTWGDLIELTQIHLDLAGRAFWHLITTNPSGGGEVIGIQSLNPDWVDKAVYNKTRTKVVGWELKTSGASKRVIPADDIVMFRYPDPVDPHGGISPIRAVAMSHDMDTYSRAYAASHLRNHAQPTGILTTEAELTRDQATLISEGWQDVHEGTNRIQVLGKGAQFQSLSAQIKDLDNESFDKYSKDMTVLLSSKDKETLANEEDEKVEVDEKKEDSEEVSEASVVEEAVDKAEEIKEEIPNSSTASAETVYDKYKQAFDIDQFDTIIASRNL